jgi:ATP-binding cassette subfamily F protein 3
VLLKARDISKSFGPKDVLRSVDLELDRRDRVGLVGPNGAGKSTLLKILAGEMKPDLGELTFRTDRIEYLPQFHDLGDRTVEQAFEDPVLAATHSRVEELESLLANSAAHPELDLEEIALEYSRLQEELAARKDYEVEDKKRQALDIVGMTDRSGEGRLTELSGGETTRVMLARVLMQADQSDILILDEPTSHLDIETVEALEDYLLKFPGAVLVVSHDRYFLDRVVTEIWDLENGKVTPYRGNYTDYVIKKALEMDKRRIASQKNQAERERQLKIAEEQHIRLKFASTHKTRLKMVDRMEQVEAPPEQKDIRIRIQTAHKSGKNFVVAKHLSVNRGEKKVLDAIDLELVIGDKLGVFGPNGAGKTTLLKALMRELRHEGELWISPGAKIGYFAQGHDGLDSDLTAEKQMLQALGEDERLKARNLLARFQLTDEQVLTPISKLSGGERARVALAMLIAEQRNLLLLDEPTNYLDVQSRDAVEAALRGYPGALIMVTHDRYLLDAVCNQVGELKDGKLRLFKGTYSEMKGSLRSAEMITEAQVFRVIVGFTDWMTKTKLKPGDKISIAPSEMENYRWALETDKLQKVGGKELKRVKREG